MNRQRGRSLGNNSGTATWEGKPSKVKTHECIRHETRSEGLRAEQDFKRLRKPEGVAESGKETRRVAGTEGNGCTESQSLLEV
jgi:hypothetical protein